MRYYLTELQLLLRSFGNVFVSWSNPQSFVKGELLRLPGRWKHSMESEVTAIDPSTSASSPGRSGYHGRYALVSIAGNGVCSEQLQQSGRKT